MCHSMTSRDPETQDRTPHREQAWRIRLAHLERLQTNAIWEGGRRLRGSELRELNRLRSCLDLFNAQAPPTPED